MIDRRPRGSQRQRVWAHRDEILEKLNAGYNVGNIQDELGLADMSDRTFRYNVKALVKERDKQIKLLEIELLKATLDVLRPNPPKNRPRRNAPKPEKIIPTGSGSRQAEAQSKVDSIKVEPESSAEDKAAKTPRPKRKVRIGRIGGIPEGQRPLDPRKRR